MNVKNAKSVLLNNSYRINDERRLSNNTGWQLKLDSGQCVTVYDTGTICVQGRDTLRVQELFETATASRDTANGQVVRRVFVVHGHDEAAQD